MLNERGGLRQPFPPSPLLPARTTGQGGAHEVQASRAPAGRPGGHTRVAGVQPRPHPPPPSRGLADIFGDISRRQLGTMPFGGPVRAPAPSSGGGGGGPAGPGAAVLPRGGTQEQQRGHGRASEEGT